MITKINGFNNTYISQNKRISFKSKLVPNEELKDIFIDSKTILNYLNSVDEFKQYKMSLMYVQKTMINCLKNILNNGKNELWELTRNKNGELGYKLNGKKSRISKADRLKANSNNIRTITNEDFDIISSAISKLKDDLNADYESKNLDILANLHKNIQIIDNIFLKQTGDSLEKLEKQIFNSRVK